MENVFYQGLKTILMVAFLPVLMLLAGMVGVGLVIGPPVIRGYMPSRDARLKWITVAVLAGVQVSWCVLRVPSLWWQIMNYTFHPAWPDALFVGAWVGLWASHWLLRPQGGVFG